MTVRAIDCWVNVNMSGLGRPEFLKEVAKNYFKQGEDFFRDCVRGDARESAPHDLDLLLEWLSLEIDGARVHRCARRYERLLVDLGSLFGEFAHDGNRVIRSHCAKDLI